MKPAPEIDSDTPIHTAVGAAHYWHDQWQRLRMWRHVALASLAFNVIALVVHFAG